MLIITPSQGLDALRWAGPHVLLSMTPVDNSALPKHHMNSWSLICEATRCVLTVSCLHFRHLHVIFLPSEQSFFGVVLQGCQKLLDFFIIPCSVFPEPLWVLQTDDSYAHH